MTLEMLTGAEAWIYQYDPEAKTQSAVWLFLTSPVPQNSKDHPAHKGK